MNRRCLLAYILVASSTVFGATYRIDEIVIPGAFAVLPESINNAGVVVGSYYTQTEAFGFKYDKGVLDHIGSSQTGWLRPFDINNNGDVVGQASQAAFILSGATGDLSLYSQSGCLGTTFWGMNDAGSIVGDCFNPTSATTAFLFENGSFNASLPPIDQLGHVRDINNSNQVVSLFVQGQLGSSTTTLPGGYGINNLGQIATAIGVWTNGIVIPITIPGAVQIDIHKLNDRGQVVGSFYDGANFRGFIATPIPEPGTAIVGIALLAITALRASARRA
ncbi:MAG TPA: hypothetical protein VEX68_01285 [Bryobacteraceae bacterium]|nr:hypothetical protein [Bryobacteraceae bacterium]